MLSILPSRDTVLNILVTFSDIEYLGKSIMGILASFKGILAFMGYLVLPMQTSK